MAFEPASKIDTHLHVVYQQPAQAIPYEMSTWQQMLPHLRELNICKGIVMSGGENASRFADNAECMAIVAADPEHYAWMCGLDPVDPETVCDRLKRCKEQGAVGIGELMVHLPVDDPFLGALFTAAGELDLPVTFHMSPAMGVSYGIVDEPGLPLLEQALAAYPNTKFVGHSQTFWAEISADAPTDPRGRNGYPSGPVVPGGRIPALMERYPNLYCDLSAGSGGNAIMRDPAFGLAFLERFSQRLFFATDMMNTGSLFPLGNWLDEQAATGKLNMEAYRRICFGNAQYMYHL